MSLTIYANTGYAGGAFNPTSFPALLVVDSDAETAVLTWTPVRGAAGYAVYAGVREDDMLPIAIEQLDTTLELGSLALPGYAFKIVADMGNGRSMSSYLLRSGSNAVADVTVTTASQQALLAFPAVLGAIGYNVYLGTAQGQESPIPMLQTHVPGQPWAQPVTGGFLIQALTNDSTYYFMVQPIFDDWLGQCTEVVGVTPTIPIPQNLVATAGDAEVGLTWDAAAGACSYNVYQSLTSNGETPPSVKTVSTNAALITGLTDGTQYFFKVTAVMCDGGDESAMSNEANATPNVAIPTGLVAQPCDGRVKLSWTAQPTALSYNVYKSATSGGETGAPLLTGITATTCTVMGLTDGQADYFKITAVNGNGESPKSNEASTTPFQLLAPTVAPIVGDGQITLQFDSQSNVTYEAFVSTTSGGEAPPAAATASGTGASVNMVIGGLDNGTEYFFTVKATNLCGQSETSEEVNATPLPFAQLTGLNWKLPCTPPAGSGVTSCNCPSTSDGSSVLNAAPGKSFNVTLRIRGVVELKTYTGGTNDGSFWQVGGTPRIDNTNVYRLNISSPAQTYYINRYAPGGGEPLAVFVIDYQKTIQIDAGATISLHADSIESSEEANPTNLQVTDDDPDAPVVVTQPYNGQFAQIDAVAITVI